MFKRWIALSTGKITIQRISPRETNCAIKWIDFCPVDSAIQRLNNRGQADTTIYLLNDWAKVTDISSVCFDTTRSTQLFRCVPLSRLTTKSRKNQTNQKFLVLYFRVDNWVARPSNFNQVYPKTWQN